jgi:hypothetical protein
VTTVETPLPGLGENDGLTKETTVTTWGMQPWLASMALLPEDLVEDEKREI